MISKRTYMQQRWKERNAMIVPPLPGVEKANHAITGAEHDRFCNSGCREFIIISGVTVMHSFQHYFLWMALFLHCIHLLCKGAIRLQRKYIPAIVTSLLCLPYAVYVVISFILRLCFLQWISIGRNLGVLLWCWIWNWLMRWGAGWRPHLKISML